jgi:transposase InsO family protein
MCKDSTQKPQGLLKSLPIPSYPWQSIGIDFIGPLPKSGEYDYVTVVIDRLTSMVHILPCVSTIRTSEFAHLFYKEIVRLHGLPESIVSDRDTKFTSKFWQELHRLLGTKLLMSTAFHPQTDGATERANKSVSQILRTMVANDQKNWSEKCPALEIAINSSMSETTGFAPFELNYGQLPTLGRQLSQTSQFQGVQQFKDKIQLNLMAAHDAIIEN